MSVEATSKKERIFLKTKKTRYMYMNAKGNHLLVIALDIKSMEEKDDFKYLNFHITESKNNFLPRKRQLLDTCISQKVKVSFFRACVNSDLPYGYETWIINEKLKKMLDETYTRFFMLVRPLSSKQHPTIQRRKKVCHPYLWL